LGKRGYPEDKEDTKKAAVFSHTEWNRSFSGVENWLSLEMATVSENREK